MKRGIIYFILYDLRAAGVSADNTTRKIKGLLLCHFHNISVSCLADRGDKLSTYYSLDVEKYVLVPQKLLLKTTLYRKKYAHNFLLKNTAKIFTV